MVVDSDYPATTIQPSSREADSTIKGSTDLLVLRSSENRSGGMELTWIMHVGIEDKETNPI